MRTLLVSLVFICISACGFTGFPGVYRIDIEQGNIVTEEMVEQLKPGMSRRQVRFILGPPLIEDTFNQNRWDYVYVMRNGLEVRQKSQLTVYFENDRMSHFDGDFSGHKPTDSDDEVPEKS